MSININNPWLVTIIGGIIVGVVLYYLLRSKKETATRIEESAWGGVPWNGKFISYDGPIEGLKLIEDGIFQQNMAEALTSAGFNTHLNRLDNLSKPLEKGYRIVYLTDRKSWRRKITDRGQVLIAKPKE